MKQGREKTWIWFPLCINLLCDIETIFLGLFPYSGKRINAIYFVRVPEIPFNSKLFPYMFRNSCYHFLSLYYISDSVLRIWHTLSLFVLRKTLWGKYVHYNHFEDGKTKAQRSEAVFPRSHGWEMLEPEFDKLSYFQPCHLPSTRIHYINTYIYPYLIFYT